MRTSYLEPMRTAAMSFLAAALLAVTGEASAADVLESLKWEKRPLLLFSKSRSFAPLDKQIDLLRDYRPDLTQRDMLVLSTTGGQETSAAIGYVAIQRGTARQLLREFKPDPKGLTIILIGKDGNEKARWQHVVEPQEIFDLIDSMPPVERDGNQTVETQ